MISYCVVIFVVIIGDPRRPPYGLLRDPEFSLGLRPREASLGREASAVLSFCFKSEGAIFGRPTRHTDPWPFGLGRNHQRGGR